VVVLDPDKTGAVKREQLVAMFVEMYERRRDLAKSLAGGLLRTMSRTAIKA